jgi:hypothetical protein
MDRSSSNFTVGRAVRYGHPRTLDSDVSAEQYAATLASRYGVGPADLPLVLPKPGRLAGFSWKPVTIGRFSTPDLGFMA